MLTRTIKTYLFFIYDREYARCMSRLISFILAFSNCWPREESENYKMKNYCKSGFRTHYLSITSGGTGGKFHSYRIKARETSSSKPALRKSDNCRWSARNHRDRPEPSPMHVEDGQNIDILSLSNHFLCQTLRSMKK